jgi:hypothetical protein
MSAANPPAAYELYPMPENDGWLMVSCDPRGNGMGAVIGKVGPSGSDWIATKLFDDTPYPHDIKYPTQQKAAEALVAEYCALQRAGKSYWNITGELLGQISRAAGTVEKGWRVPIYIWFSLTDLLLENGWSVDQLKRHVETCGTGSDRYDEDDVEELQRGLTALRDSVEWGRASGRLETEGEPQ